MAGRIVVLEFDDRDAAETFVARDEELVRQGAVPIAMFIKPTKYCDCPDKRRQNVKNWVKGKRTGLYICSTCRKPSIHHQKGILTRLQYVFGYNLLSTEAERQ